MDSDHAAALDELADLVHAVARRLPAPSDLEPGPCTPIEIGVMRFVARNPGVSARAAADACGLPTSNFSRVLKGLVAKGLLDRRTDPGDARIAHLHATDLATRNTARMRRAWSAALYGAGLDAEMLAQATRALRRIERHLSDTPAAETTWTEQGPSPAGQRKGRSTDAG